MRTTDMADELFSGAAQPLPAGVRLATARHGGVTGTRGEIAREGLSRPRGRYVTLEMPSVSVLDERDAAVIEVCAQELRALLPPEGPVLVLGVGNRRITADALGPRTVQRILVTMGAGAAPPVRGLRPVAAVAPGVAAATGLSLQQLAAALVGQLRPAAVVCVDSLCSAEGQRLGRTVQFSDTGLYPAQADHTRHLTRDTLGVPVVAAGIPTLMQAQEGADLVVTPRALDSVIAHGAALLAGSVNRALQPRLTVQQLCWLTGGRKEVLPCAAESLGVCLRGRAGQCPFCRLRCCLQRCASLPAAPRWCWRPFWQRRCPLRRPCCIWGSRPWRAGQQNRLRKARRRLHPHCLRRRRPPPRYRPEWSSILWPCSRTKPAPPMQAR